MKEIKLELDDKTYSGIKSHTNLVKHFINVAIREKLKAYTHGVKNFNELSQEKNYQPNYSGDGILISGKEIKDSNGHALIQGNTKQIELADRSPISSVDPHATYKVVGLNTQLGSVVVKEVNK